MCEICGGTFEHFPGCPYEPEPKAVYQCCVCGEPICDGDKYIDGIKGCVCEECVQDLSIDEFMEITGEEENTEHGKHQRLSCSQTAYQRI